MSSRIPGGASAVKGAVCMKKSTVLKFAGIVFVLMALFAIACAVTGTGGGFLDLSSIARAVCIGTALVCTILAAAAWRFSKPKD